MENVMTAVQHVYNYNSVLIIAATTQHKSEPFIALTTDIKLED